MATASWMRSSRRKMGRRRESRMRDKIDHWLGEFRLFCGMVNEASPRWARILLVASLGVLLFADRVDIPGSGTKIYLIIVSIVFASTSAFVSYRVIGEVR